MITKMIKYLIFLIVPIFFSCSNDDDIKNVTLVLSKKGSIIHDNTKNENGLYNNTFFATFSNPHPKDITGHVRFTIKEYGTFSSESGVVPAAPNTEKTFFLSLETDEIIDESYLIKAEFVRE